MLKAKNSVHLLSASSIPGSDILTHIILPVFYEGQTIIILIL